MKETKQEVPIESPGSQEAEFRYLVNLICYAFHIAQRFLLEKGQNIALDLSIEALLGMGFMKNQLVKVRKIRNSVFHTMTKDWHKNYPVYTRGIENALLRLTGISPERARVLFHEKEPNWSSFIEIYGVIQAKAFHILYLIDQNFRYQMKKENPRLLRKLTFDSIIYKLTESQINKNLVIFRNRVFHFQNIESRLLCSAVEILKSFPDVKNQVIDVEDTHLHELPSSFNFAKQDQECQLSIAVITKLLDFKHIEVLCRKDGKKRTGIIRGSCFYPHRLLFFVQMEIMILIVNEYLCEVFREHNINLPMATTVFQRFKATKRVQKRQRTETICRPPRSVQSVRSVRPMPFRAPKITRQGVISYYFEKENPNKMRNQHERRQQYTRILRTWRAELKLRQAILERMKQVELDRRKSKVTKQIRIPGKKQVTQEKFRSQTMKSMAIKKQSRNGKERSKSNTAKLNVTNESNEVQVQKKLTSELSRRQFKPTLNGNLEDRLEENENERLYRSESDDFPIENISKVNQDSIYADWSLAKITSCTSNRNKKHKGKRFESQFLTRFEARSLRNGLLTD